MNAKLSSVHYRSFTAVLLWLVVVGGPSRAAAQSAAAPAGQRTVEAMLAELGKLMTEQRALIDGQAGRIAALENDPPRSSSSRPEHR